MSLRSGYLPQTKGQNWQTKKSHGSFAHSLLPTQETGPSSFPVVFLDTSLHYCHGVITQQILSGKTSLNTNLEMEYGWPQEIQDNLIPVRSPFPDIQGPSRFLNESVKSPTDLNFLATVVQLPHFMSPFQSPLDIEGQPAYLVKSILNSHRKHVKLEYLIPGRNMVQKNSVGFQHKTS